MTGRRIGAEAANAGRASARDGSEGIGSRRRAVRCAAVLALALLGPLAPIGPLAPEIGAAAPAPRPTPAGRVTDEVLVRFRAGAGAAGRAALHAAAGGAAVKEFASVEGLQLVELPPGASMARALAQYAASPDVLYVEPNQKLTLDAVPDDPDFAQDNLWGLNYAHPPFDDPDIDAPEAWTITTGSPNVVVAVIDTGIDYDHEDLAANVFRNVADCDQDGVDDDGNGWVDDCHGIDPYDGDSDPMDEDVHGTHVAGTIGAVGNNGIGVVGVDWRVKLMPCKVFDGNGNGSIAAAITCLDYVAMMKDRGVDVVATNDSWTYTDFSPSMRDAIDAQRQRGILFIAAAGNYGSCPDSYNCRLDPDNDRKPTWPASLYLPNVIAVANSIDYGWLHAASAYGRRTVHLAAPGTFIRSTTPGNTYDWFSGTSMATPHVTGVAALLKAQNPARDWRAIKNLILAGSEGDLFPDDGKLITDHRVNAHGALACANKTIVSRLRPIAAAVTAVVGRPMELSALNIQCAVPNGNPTVTVSPGGQTVTLRDDGGGSDQQAGDGIYSGQWTPPAQGQFSLAFPGADVVGVQVLAGSYGVAAVPYAGRTIAGTHVPILPTTPGVITSPFPLRFAGGSFTTLYVDSRGALQFDGGDYDSDLAAYNEPLPSPFHSTLIAPLWDQIMVFTFGDVVWDVTGSAPNRELVVEWRLMERSDRFCALFEGYVTFQVVFFEGSSDILFNYPDATVGGECPDLDAGGSATVGIQVSPDVAAQLGFNAPVVPDGTSLLWTLGGGEVPRPEIAVTPASASFGTVAVGSSADTAFVVKNTGTGTLAGQASAAAPFAVVSGGTYSLGAGQTQTVTVRFQPATAGDFAGDVAFTGGGGATRAVQGTGGEVAACEAVLGWQLKLGKLGKPGANTLSLRGSFFLAPSELAAFDPSLDGMQIALSDGAGGRVDMVVQGGPYDAMVKRGWKVNAARTTYTFVDASKLPGPGSGITKVVVKRSRTAPGLVTVQATGKNASYDVAPPPVVDLALADGTCFEARFPGPTRPSCLYNGSRTTLLCR